LTAVAVTLPHQQKVQRTMLPREVAYIRECLQSEPLGVETIIAGVDSGDPPLTHIYSVGGFTDTAEGLMRETSAPVCHDGSGFYAIGSGASQFEMQFMFLGYDRAWPFMDALLLTCLAKRQAERSPGVGRTTDLLAIRGKGGLYNFPRHAVEAVERYCEEFEREVNTQRSKTLEKMTQNVRFIWEEQAASATGVSPDDPVSND
jgi:hypothetical protein